MKRQIKIFVNSFEHDDTVGEQEIRSGEPLFFRTPHGKRETFTFYRGCIIVRNTVQFTGCKPERKTTIYLYFRNLEGRSGTFCAGSHCNSVKQAKSYIDYILDVTQDLYPSDDPNRSANDSR